jgi:membrane protease subunit (stomatin/prohibitin family)
MGFLFGKKQLLKVIEWEDSSKDTIVYKFPLNDRYAIMNSSTLVVRPSQIALFIHKGQICDVFAPGTYKLSTENIPFLTRILALPTGGENTITADVYFVNTKQITGQKWGTQNPIMMRDSDFGNVRIRAFGVYSFKVENAKTFMEEMFGTNEVYKADDVADQLKPTILQIFADAVAESKISALDLAANYKEFSETILNVGQVDFEKFGLKLCTMVIENISLPEEVEKALDERTKLGVMSDKMGTYMQYQAGQAMTEAAKNPNGNNFAGMGVGLGAGMGIGQAFTGGINQAVDTPRVKDAKDTNNEGQIECPSCHAKISKNAKFCPECGQKLPQAKFCPECGAKISDSAKFCPECGHKLQ